MLNEFTILWVPIVIGVHKPVNQFRFRFGQPKPVSVNKPVETSLEETGFGFKP
nr:hypothetical protein [Tanacetum cinerariifolium]